MTVTWDTISRSARAPGLHRPLRKASSAGTVRATSASRLLPIFFSARALSRAPLTAVPDGDDRVPLGHGVLVQGVVGEGLVHLVEDHVAAVVAAAVGHGLPDLVAGEGQDGGEQLGHGVQDQVQGGLGGAAAEAVLLLAVQPVLDDVQIEVDSSTTQKSLTAWETTWNS